MNKRPSSCESPTAQTAFTDSLKKLKTENTERFHVNREKNAYIADVRQSMEEIRAGETYEVCLTNRFWGASPSNPEQLYSTLRRINPAPYGAWLDINLRSPSSPELDRMVVACSSPERFLQLNRDGCLEAKPIK